MSFQTKWFLALLLSPMCWCQQVPSDLTARTLWFREQPDDDQLPPVPVAKSRQAPKATKTQIAEAQGPGVGNPVGPAKNASVQSSDEGRSIPAVQHLGLRYNLLLVDENSGKGEAVESEREFQPGECIALQFEANHSGYLYVLERGSSGIWKPLLPSPEMPDEANIVRSRRSVRVPQKYCFRIEGPPGVEQVFVMLSRNPAEVYNLHETIKSGSPSTARVTESGGAAPAMSAENNLSHEVSSMEAIMRARDLKITKIGQPSDSEEPPVSVYIVNASLNSSDKVVTEIQIKHE